MNLLADQSETQKKIMKNISQLESPTYYNHLVNKELLEKKRKEEKLAIWESQAKGPHELHALKDGGAAPKNCQIALRRAL